MTSRNEGRETAPRPVSTPPAHSLAAWRRNAMWAATRLRLNEAIPLLTIGAVSFFGWAFVMIADGVTDGDTHEIDRAILLALRNPADAADPIGPGWFEEAMRDVTALGGHTILAFVWLAATVYVLMAGKRQAAIMLLVSIGGGMILSTLLKLGFDRPRPDLVQAATRVYTASFPSGHAMLSAVTYLTVGVLLARVQRDLRIKIYFIGLSAFITVAVGLSRIYLGVHWPSDVLAGWCVGAGWASLCWFVALVLQQRGRIERNAPLVEDQGRTV